MSSFNKAKPVERLHLLQTSNCSQKNTRFWAGTPHRITRLPSNQHNYSKMNWFRNEAISYCNESLDYCSPLRTTVLWDLRLKEVLVLIFGSGFLDYTGVLISARLIDEYPDAEWKCWNFFWLLMITEQQNYFAWCYKNKMGIEVLSCYSLWKQFSQCKTGP